MSQGSGSVLNLTKLTSFSVGSQFAIGGAGLSDTSGGEINSGNLTTFNGVDVKLDGTGNIATKQWATLTAGSLTITGGSYTFPSLSNIESSSLNAQDGGSLTLPAVTRYEEANPFSPPRSRPQEPGAFCRYPLWHR